jgi:hypothetical protein
MKRAPVVGLAFSPDTSAVKLDNPPRDREPQAGAQLRGLRRLPLRIEDVVELFLRDGAHELDHDGWSRPTIQRHLTDRVPLLRRQPAMQMLSEHGAVGAREKHHKRLSDQATARMKFGSGRTSFAALAP